jgi:hypothetical protein
MTERGGECAGRGRRVWRGTVLSVGKLISTVTRARDWRWMIPRESVMDIVDGNSHRQSLYSYTLVVHNHRQFALDSDRFWNESISSRNKPGTSHSIATRPGTSSPPLSFSSPVLRRTGSQIIPLEVSISRMNSKVWVSVQYYQNDLSTSKDVFGLLRSILFFHETSSRTEHERSSLATKNKEGRVRVSLIVSVGNRSQAGLTWLLG